MYEIIKIKCLDIDSWWFSFGYFFFYVSIENFKECLIFAIFRRKIDNLKVFTVKDKIEVNL